MKLRKLSLVLLALLLAAMAMVPMVSAANNYSKEKFTLADSNTIPKEVAYKNAMKTMQEFTSSGALNPKWDGATLDPKPLEIYDLNGAILTYQFTAEKGGMKIGVVDASASKVVGGPVLSIDMNPTNIDGKKIDSKIEEIRNKKYSDYSLLSKKIVSYQYPKLGVLVIFSNPKTGDIKRIIIDTNNYSVVPEEKSRIEGEPGAWSYYDEMSVNQMKENLQMGANLQKLNVTPKYASQKILSFTRYSQTSENWCAVTVAQMISQKYGYSRNQQAIANVMGNGGGQGSTPSMELSYYQSSISSGGLNKTNSIDVYSSSANWYNAADEIDGGRPLKVGNMGHARAIAGYKIENGINYLYIYDPDPNRLLPSWEMYTGTYNNFVYVK